MSYILEMKDINKSFFGVQVLHNAQLQVLPGEVHVLLGENGAGKSTLIKILSGAYRREEGEIFLEGKPFQVATPKEALDKGISVIYQEFNLLPDMPIWENILIGKEKEKKKGILDIKANLEEAKKYLDMIGLNLDPRTHVADLSVAQKQMVEIAKALSNDAKVLVLDEPTAAITAAETTLLFKIIRKLKADGLGIIYISHRMSELFEIGDRVTVMRDGEYVATRNLRETTEQELTRLMVGREVSFDKVTNEGLTDEVMLEVKDLSYRGRVKDVSFKLRKGEILGLSGLVGSGRTEIAKCIINAYTKDKGQVFVEGQELTGGISGAVKKGVVYLSEDRKDEGLVLMHSVRDNIALPNLHMFAHPFLNKKAIANASQDYVKKLHIKTAGDLLEAKNLSGGNQQKVVIAKWLLNQGKVFIFDEPTRGIDVGARDEIYNIMLDLTKSGASILMISSDLVEVMKMCDRIIVMREGEMAVTLENDGTLTEDQIMAYSFIGGDNK